MTKLQVTHRRYYVRSPDGSAIAGFDHFSSARHAALAKGASANAQDRCGAPALMWAIGAGHADCMRLLLASGADANVRDAEGVTALALAPRKNRPDLLEILLAAGAVD